MQTIQPASKQVFAKPTEAETQTASGIILSKESVDKPRTATVINVGPGIDWLRQNDTIVYKQYTTTEITLNNQEFIMIAEEDILGKVVETS